MTMCPFCNVEHESVQAMGTIVVGCPKLGGNEMVMVRTVMTDAEKADHERAAVALETNKRISDNRGTWAVLARKAWAICDQQPVDETFGETVVRAARLLRECIEKGEPLP